MSNFGIVCRTCGAGHLISCKRFRMSGPVVAIGFILLIPSVLGVIFCVAMFFLSGGATTATFAAQKQDAHDEMVRASIPADDINAIENLQPLTPMQSQGLTTDQKRATDDATLKLTAGRVGAGLAGVFAGGASICLGVSCFVGGLLGWLLVMRKRVLQCQNCSAVVAAS
jgi:hypothetical protein